MYTHIYTCVYLFCLCVFAQGQSMSVCVCTAYDILLDHIVLQMCPPATS